MRSPDSRREPLGVTVASFASWRDQDGGGIKLNVGKADTQQLRKAAGRVHSVAFGCTPLALGAEERQGSARGGLGAARVFTLAFGASAKSSAKRGCSGGIQG